MASNNELNVRNKGIVHTTDEWTNSSNSNYKGNIPINKGELAFTENDGIVTDMKIGDGTSTWSNLSYYLIIPNIKPIIEKTYTGVTCTANDDPAAWLYFGNVLPDNYNEQWEITYKIYATISGSTESNISYVKFTGIRNAIVTWAVYNSITNSNYRAYYNHIIYRAKEAGVTNNYGHALGLRLQSSWNPNVAANSRTIKVEIMDMKKCSFTIYDSMLLYANIPGTGTTNYDGRNEYDGTSNGFKSAGDNNDTTTVQLANMHLTAGTNGLKQYSLCMMDQNGTYQSFTTNSGTGTKTKNTVGFLLGHIFYLSMSGNVAAGAVTGSNVVRAYQSWIDFRYSSNCGTGLTTNKMVYIVGTFNKGLFYLADTWWTQTIPSTPDGKLYIPVGMAYSTYQIDFMGYKGAYFYNGTTLAALELPPLTEAFSGTSGKALISNGDGTQLKWRGINNTIIDSSSSNDLSLTTSNAIYNTLHMQKITEKPSTTETANWDFQNNNPSTMSSVNIQGTNASGTMVSDLTGVSATVDAAVSGTNIKLQYNTNGYAQFNTNTRIRIPVRSTDDVVTIISYTGQYKYTVGGTAATANTTVHTATSSEVSAGFVDIVSTGTAYIYSIKLVRPVLSSDWYYIDYLQGTTGLLKLDYTDGFTIKPTVTDTTIKIGDTNNKGILRLYNGSYYGDLVSPTLTGNITWTLPNSTSTLASESYVQNYVKNGKLTLQIGGTTKTTFTANQSGNGTFNIVKSDITGLGISDTDEKVKFNNHDSGWAKIALVANNVSDNLITTALFTKALSMTHITDNNKTDVYLQIGAHEESNGTVSYHRSAIIRMYGLSSNYVDFRIRNGELSGNYYVDDIGKVLIAPTSDSTNGNGDGTYYFAFPKTKTTSPNIINYNDSVNVNISTGTTSANGYDTLNLGNNIRNGVAGNKIGHIRLYGKGPSSGENNTAGYIDVSNANQTNDTAYSQKLYPKSGNIALIDPDLVVVSKPSVTGVTMNTVATYGNSMGMVNLTAQSSDTNHAIHPAVDTSNWHHYLQMSYIIDNATSNMWQTQIMTKAGTTDLWIRSRSGGTVSDDTAWTAGWTRILTGTNWTNVINIDYFLAGTNGTSAATSNVTNPYLILRSNDVNQEIQLVGSSNISIIGKNNAATFSLESKLITNTNLNNLKVLGFYAAKGNNTTTNKPSGIDAFGILTYPTATSWVLQEIIEANTHPGRRWQRYWNTSVWSEWVPLPTFTTTPTSDQVVVTDDTFGGIKSSGYTIATSVPENAVFTDTDTKVTAVENHYPPTADSNSQISVDASSSTAATWNSTSLVTGVNIQRDVKGHVTGVTVDSIKMPANPNSDTKVRQSLVSTDDNYRPLLLSYANETNTTVVDNISYRDNKLTYKSSTGKLKLHGMIWAGYTGTVPTSNTDSTEVPIKTEFKFDEMGIYLGIKKNNSDENNNYLRMSHSHTYLKGGKVVSINSNDGTVYIGADSEPARNGSKYGMHKYSMSYNNAERTFIAGGYGNSFINLQNTGIAISNYNDGNISLNTDYSRVKVSPNTVNIRGNDAISLYTNEASIEMRGGIEITTDEDPIKITGNNSSIYLGRLHAIITSGVAGKLDIHDNRAILESNVSKLRLSSDTIIKTNKFRLYNTTEGHSNITLNEHLRFYIDTNLPSMTFGTRIFEEADTALTFATGKSSIAFGDGIVVTGYESMGVGIGNLYDINSHFSTYIPTAKTYNNNSRKWSLTLTTTQINTIKAIYNYSIFMVRINGRLCKAQVNGTTTLDLINVRYNDESNSIYSLINDTAISNLGITIFKPDFLVRGDHSFATGESLLVYGDNQLVIGKWNASDTTSLFIIGQGTSSARKSLLTVNGSTGNLLHKATMIIESANGNYAEGIRINKGNANYSTILLGANAGTVSGTQDGAWWIGVNHANYSRRLMFGHNGSGATNAYFYAEDSGTANISLHIKGITATGTVELMGSDLRLKTSGSSSDDSGDIAFYYGNGQEKSRIWMTNTYDTKAGPNYRVYKSDGTSLYNGTLPLADGTGASGTWGISISGNASTATSATSATSASRLTIDEVTVQTGSSAQSHITLDTLMTWLITTKKYIPSNVKCNILISCSWSYAGNDILQFNANGTNYELQLAGCKIEFIGHASNYNTGQFRLIIHSSPAVSFTEASGYTKFPTSHVCEYFCNGSGYSPIWKVYVDRSDLGSAAYTASTAYATSDHTQSIAKGGTGATTAEDALTNLGLGLTTITKAITFAAADTWYDTGISGTNIPTNGTYIVQVSGITNTGTSMWNEIWSGIMSWRAEGTNSTDTNEILLHQAGHASNKHTIFLRTVRQSSSVMKLQIAANFSYDTAVDVTFKFRKMI